MTDYSKELIVNEYNETQYTIEFRTHKFFWPKQMPLDWLTNWFIRESFEENDSHNYLLLYNPSSDDVLYDMGSSEGVFAKKCIDRGVKKVYAFDPLQCFVDSMNLLFKDEPRLTSFCIGFADKPYTDTYASLPIVITTLDSFMDEHPDIMPPTIIKMDLEGYDLAALMGGYNTLQKYHPDLVLCKYHKPSDKSDFINFLSPLGYKMTGETSEALVYFSVN